ncbi:30S ribosomal protein S27ae [Desulfobacter postgatei]|uniref:Ribosomal protein S27 n=1 Tax=Desulfobacter postgatei 2ac9 TaxID=879212 RepID=I5B188_9BACT|nr:30S ribosomal protein S27ae [Desulfobacter postgatei]EIM63251.1 Ribosomal protein S27 [Desulfobacter postgatei 2ac9]
MSSFFLTGSIGTSVPLKRVSCPKCLTVQIVAFSKRRQSVKCKFCGTTIQPGKGRKHKIRKFETTEPFESRNSV